MVLLLHTVLYTPQGDRACDHLVIVRIPASGISVTQSCHHSQRRSRWADIRSLAGSTSSGDTVTGYALLPVREILEQHIAHSSVYWVLASVNSIPDLHHVCLQLLRHFLRSTILPLFAPLATTSACLSGVLATVFEQAIEFEVGLTFVVDLFCFAFAQFCLRWLVHAPYPPSRGSSISGTLRLS